VCTGYTEPILNGEYFLTEMFASMQRHGGARPGLFHMAYLVTRYRSEFEVVELPRPVQADAPPPASR
jgi:hypothetical protein